MTPGANENTAEDMGRALANVRALREATGAMPILVHHAGKDTSRGSRGWSGIKAAADVQLEVIRHDNDTREIHLEKVKDGEDGVRFGFELEVVTLGVDEDGDAITSCIVKHVETAFRQRRLRGNGPRGEKQRKVMECAVKCGAGTVAGAPPKDVIDQAVESIPYDPAVEAGQKAPRDQRRGHVTRALAALCDRGHLVTIGDRVYFPSTAPADPERGT